MEQLYQDGVTIEEVWQGAAEGFQAEESIEAVANYLESGLLRVHQFQTEQLLQAIEPGEWSADAVIERASDAWRQEAFGAYGEVLCWLVYLAGLHRPSEPNEPVGWDLPIIETGIFGPAGRW